MRTLKNINILIQEVKDKEKKKKGNDSKEDPAEIVFQDDEDKTLEDPELNTDRPPKDKQTMKVKTPPNRLEQVKESDANLSDAEVEDILNKIESGDLPDDIDEPDDMEEPNNADYAEYVDVKEDQDYEDVMLEMKQLDEAIIRKRVFRRDRKTGAIRKVLKLISTNPRSKIKGGREVAMTSQERRKRAIAAKRRGRNKSLVRKAQRRGKQTRMTRLRRKG